MRRDWIEFEVDGGELLVKYYDIESIRYAFSKVAGPCASISLSNGTSHAILEPYKQVKQKVMDAEKIDLSDVVVEHFTRDEYETMLTLVRCERDECEQDNIPARVKSMNRLIDKLNEILKDNNE